MRRKREALPTAGELRLLQVLWSLGRGTVEEIVDAHPASLRPNAKTTTTILRGMERKGFLRHEVKDRMFLYQPILSLEAVNRGYVHALVERNFGGSASDLFMFLLENKPLAAKDVQELENFLRGYRGQN